MARIVRSPRLFIAFIAALCLAATTSSDLHSATRRRPVSPSPIPEIDSFRSLMITDAPALEGFTLQRVMESLVARSETSTTALELYRQMFDTQNPRPGFTGSGIHCDDETTEGTFTRNGFPIHCPSPEGVLADTDPFESQSSESYLPIAVVNRFDLSPPDGENCGQYRVIFAKRSGIGNASDRIHLIFEAVLPNPFPQLGLNGCRPIALFWADLSTISSVRERASRMEMFFFDGFGGFPPVLDPAHLGAEGGSIRTSQFMTRGAFAGRSPRFYQFELDRRCDDSGCRLIAEPAPLENMPYGSFFNGEKTSAQATAFREFFLTQVRSLAVRDVNLYSMEIPESYNVTESDGESEPVFIYDGQFNKGLGTPEGQAFAAGVQAELDSIGSKVLPVEIMARADTLTCAGCHQIDGEIGEGVVFPRSLGFEHVTEDPRHMQTGEDGELSRFGISPALRDVFIPHRKRILEDFLLSGKPPVHSQ